MSPCLDGEGRDAWHSASQMARRCGRDAREGCRTTLTGPKHEGAGHSQALPKLRQRMDGRVFTAWVGALQDV